MAVALLFFSAEKIGGSEHEGEGVEKKPPLYYVQ